MSLENFKPEDGSKYLSAELHQSFSSGFEVKFSPVPGNGSIAVFVTITDFKSPSLESLGIERQMVRLNELEESINGVGGSLANLIRAARMKLESERKTRGD